MFVGHQIAMEDAYFSQVNQARLDCQPGIFAPCRQKIPPIVFPTTKWYNRTTVSL